MRRFADIYEQTLAVVFPRTELFESNSEAEKRRAECHQHIDDGQREM
jgi:hypothetical protein